MNLNTDNLLPFVPVLALALLLIVWCLVDIVRSPRVQHLPKLAWALLVVVFVPTGAILYLVIGRTQKASLRDEDLR